MPLIHLLTAQPKAGKTQAALSLAGERVLIFVPSAQNANPKLTEIPYLRAEDFHNLDLEKFQEKHPKARVIIGIGRAELIQSFTGPEWEGYTFIFDDLPVLFPYQKDAKIFAEFSAGIRHRQGQVIVTTQYIRGVATPLMRAISDQITQVGPLIAEDEARILYQMGASAKYPTFKAFYKAVQNNPKYKLFPIKEA